MWHTDATIILSLWKKFFFKWSQRQWLHAKPSANMENSANIKNDFSELIALFNSLYFLLFPLPLLLPFLTTRWWNIRGTATSATPGVPMSSGLSPSKATPAIYLVSEGAYTHNTHWHTHAHTHRNTRLISQPLHQRPWPFRLAAKLAVSQSHPSTAASKCQLYHIFIFSLCYLRPVGDWVLMTLLTCGILLCHVSAAFSLFQTFVLWKNTGCCCLPAGLC